MALSRRVLDSPICAGCVDERAEATWPHLARRDVWCGSVFERGHPRMIVSLPWQRHCRSTRMTARIIRVVT